MLQGNRIMQKFDIQVIVGLAISIITPVQNWFVRLDIWPKQTGRNKNWPKQTGRNKNWPKKIGARCHARAEDYHPSTGGYLLERSTANLS
jgi:hypothetical protein